MKFTVIFFCLILSSTLGFCQDRQYFDSTWHQADKANAKYYRIIKKEGSLFFVKDYFISNKLQFEGHSSIDAEPLILEGKATWYNESGQAIDKAEYLHGKRNGKYQSFYSNGNQKASGHYKDDVLNGTFTEYYPSGQISSTADFENGKINGQYLNYQSDGQLVFKIHKKQNLMDGPYEMYRHGILTAKGNARNDIQEGMCYNYYDNGKLRRQYFVKDGKLDGIFYELSLEGDTSSYGQFSNGMPLSYQSERLANYSKFSARMELVDSIEYWKIYRDSNLIIRSFYKQGIKTGKWELYSFDGKKLFQTRDYSASACAKDKYLQTAKEEFDAFFFLSKRFRYDTDIFGGDCAAIKIESHEIGENEHPFYHLAGRDNQKIVEKGLGTPSSTIRDYKEPANKKEFLEKNNCQNKYGNYAAVSFCTRKFGNTTYKVFLSEIVEDLEKIKKQLKPADNEILFFYQKFVERKYDLSVERSPKRYMAFSLPKVLKEAYNAKIMDELEVVKILEHDIFDISGFSGTMAADYLRKELKN